MRNQSWPIAETPETPPLAPHDPPDPVPQAAAWGRKQAIAIEIALQTQVLKTCPVHRQLYLDDAVNPACAFRLAVELVRGNTPYVELFENDLHELTDILSDTLGTTPSCCPECASPPTH